MNGSRKKLVFGIAFLGVALIAWFAITGGSSKSPSPYADKAVTGTITFYDQAGHVVTQGDVTTKPFVWRAVSSRAAAAPYNGSGATATLFAYQPRQNATPVLWSGDSLTASTPFTDPAHPTVSATATDFSLQDFLSEFPARWDGAIQVRIYLDAPGQTALTSSYVAANLKISGDVWTQVPG